MLRARAVVFLTLIFLVATTATAFAEGYNRGTAIVSPGTPGWGELTGDARTGYQGINMNTPGPHGGYTTTTNKCQDCHSTHYAYGAYKLLRADVREAACDFCHGGGGGANTNIMMDNAYTKTAEDMALTNGPAADATTTMGFGTGHTLGYKGNAPADVKPAYSQQDGFSCFDCHTPHGNSARVLTTFFAPGRFIINDAVTFETTHIRFDYNTMEVAEVVTVPWSIPERDIIENIDIVPPGGDPVDDWVMAWGIEQPYRNIVVKYNFSAMGLGSNEVVYRKPIFETGRFLLLKNPDDENGGGLAGDLATTTVDVGGVELTTDGSNKISVNWEDPLGPAMTYDGGMPVYYTTNDERFPFPLFITGTTQDRPGIATEGEFCIDCHDGTAGLASQAAEVWHSTEETYVVAYAHDVQPRGCDRQMILNSDDDMNFGPDCRSCHSGAASCFQCHAESDSGIPPVEMPLERVWDTAGYPDFTEGKSTYQAQASFKTVGPEINVGGIGAPCMDGGFSFPHRTLGSNMLKDDLWGVDYDGTPVAPGELRDSNTLADIESLWAGGAGLEVPLSHDLGSIIEQPAENLDSACIDCHNANVWSDEPATQFTVHNYFYEAGYRADGGNPDWNFEGWELLLKGLP